MKSTQMQFNYAPLGHPLFFSHLHLVRTTMTDAEANQETNDEGEAEEAPPDDGKNPIERLIFAMVVVVAMYCGLEAEKFYAKWKTIPTVVTFNDRPIEVSKIPFPAVTICSENRVRRRVIDFELEYNTLRAQIDGSIPFKSSEQQLLVDAASLQCYSKLYPHSSLLRTRTVPNATLFKTLEKEIAPKFRTYECSFLGKRYACKDVFKPILTDYGLCYTFNMLDDHELYTTRQQDSLHFPLEKSYHSTWHLERGYDTDQVNDQDYPRRNGRDVGHDSGLRVWLIIEKNDKDRQDVCSAGHADAFRVLLHLPSEFPSMLHGKYIQVTPGSASHVSIRPHVIWTPGELRDKRYNPDIRGCFFPEERNLSMFKTYTLSNCEADCINDIYRKYCECQLFYYPLEKGSNYTLCPIISNKDVKEEYCDKPDKLNAYNILKHVPGKRRSCECLPSCHQILYEYEHTTTRMELSPRFQIRAGLEFSELAIFFEEHLIMAEQRNELFSLTDVFGLIGLMTGFSVISGAEVVAHFLKKLVDCIKARLSRPPAAPSAPDQPASGGPAIMETISSLITPDTIQSFMSVINEK